jgi:hypothetical protein
MNIEMVAELFLLLMEEQRTVTRCRTLLGTLSLIKRHQPFEPCFSRHQRSSPRSGEPLHPLHTVPVCGVEDVTNGAESSAETVFAGVWAGWYGSLTSLS